MTKLSKGCLFCVFCLDRLQSEQVFERAIAC